MNNTLIYYFGIFFLIAIFGLYTLNATNRNYQKSIYGNNTIIATILFCAVVLLLGTYPVRLDIAEDRTLYAYQFIFTQHGEPDYGNDKLFGLYMLLCTKIMSYQLWFVVTAFIYTLNLFIFCKKAAGCNYFILFLLSVFSFSFFSYGVNTIRAGFAASFLLLALAYNEKKVPFYTAMCIAIGCHFSMIIPSIAIFIAKHWNSPKLFLKLWLISIPLSAVAGGLFESVFPSMGGSDARISYLNPTAEDKEIYNVGFRIDFIIYSCIPIFLGYYYIVKCRFNDRLYSILYNSYILANIFWILVIRANYSDRFAYLSWFLYTPVIIYPLLKTKLVPKQNIKIAYIILGSGLFTFFMYLKS